MSEDNILYDENSMQNKNVNITVPAKSNSNLTFTLCIPNDIDNEFAFTNGMAEWQFTVADDNSTTPTVTATENTTTPSNTVKSGDNRPTAILSMLLCISMAVIILTIRKGGKDDSNT